MSNLTIEAMRKAFEKFKEGGQEKKFLFVSGKDLIFVGMEECEGETIFSDSDYLVEIGNYPFSFRPTAIKKIER